MRLEEILNHNRAFVAGRTRAPLPGAVTLPLAVVACYDPRLDSLLRDALGLAPAEAFLFRVSGALLRPDSNSLRSLANSVFFFGVSEVMVVGHSSCRMASFSSPDYIAAFRARGVARDAFGSNDLREWAGAIPSPRAGVLRSLDALTMAPYLPRDLRVSGVVLDDASGALELVSEAATLEVRSAGLPTAFSPAPAPAEPAAEPAARPPEATSAGAPPEIEQVREFVRLLESTVGWRDELMRARIEIGQERNPLAKLARLEKFLRRATANTREVAQAFERLKKEASDPEKRFDVDQLLSLFLGAGGRTPR